VVDERPVDERPVDARPVDAADDPVISVDRLARALTIKDHPTVRVERGLALQSIGRYAEAIVDYTDALARPGADHDLLLYRRGQCHARIGALRAARRDLIACAELGGPHAFAAMNALGRLYRSLGAAFETG